MAKAQVISGLKAEAETRRSLPEIFEVRIAELWSWAEHLPYPGRVRELHDMRIAAKRLRYCFEFFSHCFGPESKAYLKRFKDLQDYLGEIHDCDVWVDYLRNQLRDAFRGQNALRKSLKQYVGADPELRTAAGELRATLKKGPAHGLLMMMEDVVDRRDLLYAGLLELWSELELQNFRGQLTRMVADAARGPEVQ